MEIEPRIAKQHKYHHYCSCKNYRGKGMEGGKSVFGEVCVFVCVCVGGGGGGGWPEDREFVKENKCVLGHPIARHILTTGLQKCL